MIPINELRQGNYYRCKVYNGNNDVILPFTWQEYKYAHLFDPIPLTEEVLRAAGFTPTGNMARREYWIIGGIIVGISGRVFFRDESRDDVIIANIQYLHQLQNLYFALTGSELEVSLPVIGNSPIRDNK